MYRYILGICSLLRLYESLQLNFEPSPEGFRFKSAKVTLENLDLIPGDLNGDKVCAQYFSKSLDAWYIKRAALFRKRRFGMSPEYKIPYTIYPTKTDPIIQYPVEAVLGETYESPVKDTEGKTTWIPGCYIACQDLRKTIEWVMPGKIFQKIQVRLKPYFAFPCPSGYYSRTTTRPSMREYETQEEYDAGIAFLRSIGPRVDFSMMTLYDDMLKGKSGLITGCECYIPTEEERVLADAERRQKRTREETSWARINTKRKTTNRKGWRKDIKDHERELKRPRTGDAMTDQERDALSQDFDRYFPADARLSDEEAIDDVQIDDLDQIPGEIEHVIDEAGPSEPTKDDTVEPTLQDLLGSGHPEHTMTCHDYDYPDYEVGFTIPAAPPTVDVAEINQAVSFLQASLMDFAEMDSWLNFGAGDEAGPSNSPTVSIKCAPLQPASGEMYGSPLSWLFLQAGSILCTVSATLSWSCTANVASIMMLKPATSTMASFWLLIAFIRTPSSNALPNMLSSHTEGFIYKNSKIFLTDPVTVPTTGDQVCALYYAKYFKDFAKDRAYFFHNTKRRRGDIPQYHYPYTMYPTRTPPIIEYPVEAILGEIYEPLVGDTLYLSGKFGCYVGRQDIRKTLEWVLGAKISKTIHMRAKFFFGFECAPNMIVRLTYRQSWREAETVAEFQEALQLLKDLGKRVDFSVFNYYNLLLKGESGIIVGCECVIPTEEERIAAVATLKIIRQAKYSGLAQSRAGEMSKRKTKRTRTSQNTSVPADAGPSDRVAAIDDAILDDFELHHPRELEAGASVAEQFEDFQLEELDSIEHQGHCHDYDYPDIDVEAAAQTNIDPLAESPAVLLATLSEFISLDPTEIGKWLNTMNYAGASSSNRLP